MADDSTTLTPEQCQLARGLLAEHVEHRVREAEAALARAEEEARRAHEMRRAWQAGGMLTPLQAAAAAAEQHCLYVQAAQALLLGGVGTREDVESLRASADILARYVHQRYGTPRR